MKAAGIKNYGKKMGEINKLLDVYPWEPRHAAHVRDLALMIFDRTKNIHSLGGRERFLLEAAAILHDIGFAVSAAKHHKHSKKIISDYRFETLDNEEISLIAQIARYHRKAHPHLKHSGFRRLGNPDRDVVAKLSAVLRIADGLDRTHAQLVKDVKVIEKKDEIIFQLSPAMAGEEDLYGAEKKKGLFEEVFQKKAVFAAEARP